MSMNMPPSSVATIDVAMVTIPNVRSMVSCGRSNSSYPACTREIINLVFVTHPVTKMKC